jgi:hypothetical protein
LRHATGARRVVPLRAATKFFRHPSFFWVRSCSFLRRLASRFRSLRLYLGSPTGIILASSLRTS